VTERSPGLSAVDRTERWLAARRPLVVAAVALAAALVRAAYLVELTDGPLLAQHLWEESDMWFFDRWARDIEGGDWLSDRPLHPLHSWYRELAAAYFASHPEAAEALARDPATAADPAQALWNRWLGGKTFHQEPLYPYLVALTYTVAGPDVRAVFVWQMMLGVATTVLVTVLTQRWFGHLAGAVAGALAVLLAPFVMYDVVLLRTTATTFAALALVALLEWALPRPGWRSWLVIGLAFGVALLLQTTFALLLAGAFLLVAWRSPGPVRARAGRGAALALGTVLALLPAVARNVAVGVPPFALSSVGPLVFLASNTADYAPEKGFAFGEQAVHVLLASDGDSTAIVRGALATHPGPRSHLRQLWRKFTLAWNWWEAPNNANFYYYRLQSRVLRMLPVTFALVSPLALLGLALSLLPRATMSRGDPMPRARRLAPAYLLVGALLAPLVAFYVLSRFRVSLAVAVIPFAAAAVVALLRWASERWWAAFFAALATLAALGAWTSRPLASGRALIDRADWMVPFDTYYAPRMEDDFRRRDWGAAVALLDRALRHEPPAVAALRGDAPANDEESIRYASFFGMVHFRLAQALERAGDRERGALESRVAGALLKKGRLAPPDPRTDRILPENQ
jgi:4-amino-4-deoxy-L-arabinose transferase-like glycosyltransferase